MPPTEGREQVQTHNFKNLADKLTGKGRVIEIRGTYYHVNTYQFDNDPKYYFLQITATEALATSNQRQFNLRLNPETGELITECFKDFSAFNRDEDIAFFEALQSTPRMNGKK